MEHLIFAGAVLLVLLVAGLGLLYTKTEIITPEKIYGMDDYDLVVIMHDGKNANEFIYNIFDSLIYSFELAAKYVQNSYDINKIKDLKNYFRTDVVSYYYFQKDNLIITFAKLNHLCTKEDVLNSSPNKNIIEETYNGIKYYYVEIENYSNYIICENSNMVVITVPSKEGKNLIDKLLSAKEKPIPNYNYIEYKNQKAKIEFENDKVIFYPINVDCNNLKILDKFNEALIYLKTNYDKIVEDLDPEQAKYLKDIRKDIENMNKPFDVSCEKVIIHKKDFYKFLKYWPALIIALSFQVKYV
jgi:hypothetical protein